MPPDYKKLHYLRRECKDMTRDDLLLDRAHYQELTFSLTSERDSLKTALENTRILWNDNRAYAEQLRKEVTELRQSFMTIREVEKKTAEQRDILIAILGKMK